ncbi:MAG: rod shape-determining protein MreD [Rhodopirellula sp.]|nr:rod shape-determining protein MreD [Rhodopirellula sp.]
MRLMGLIPILYLAAILETSLADTMSIGHVSPVWLAMIAVVWVIEFPSPRAFLVAGAIGLIGDLIGPGRPGLAVAVFLLIGYGVARLRARWAADAIVWRVGVVWVAVTMMAIALASGRRFLGETAVPMATLLGRSLGVGVYTAAMALPVLLVLKWLREPFAADEPPSHPIRL